MASCRMRLNGTLRRGHGDQIQFENAVFGELPGLTRIWIQRERLEEIEEKSSALLHRRTHNHSATRGSLHRSPFPPPLTAAAAAAAPLGETSLLLPPKHHKSLLRYDGVRPG
jgi:hypothetical protein